MLLSTVFCSCILLPACSILKKIPSAKATHTTIPSRIRRFTFQPACFFRICPEITLMIQYKATASKTASNPDIRIVELTRDAGMPWLSKRFVRKLTQT